LEGPFWNPDGPFFFFIQIFVSLRTEGRGDEDHSALATFFEKMAQVEIKSG
jgi:hypothetical protein